MHVIPYAAIGGLLSCESDQAKGSPDSKAVMLHGQAFCSLPITPTGLPVHVNGEYTDHPISELTIIICRIEFVSEILSINTECPLSRHILMLLLQASLSSPPTGETFGMGKAWLEWASCAVTITWRCSRSILLSLQCVTILLYRLTSLAASVCI